jgi:hypothetical protein
LGLVLGSDEAVSPSPERTDLQLEVPAHLLVAQPHKREEAARRREGSRDQGHHQPLVPLEEVADVERCDLQPISTEP